MPPLLGYCGFSPCGGGFTVQASLIRYRTGRPAGQLNGAHMGDETVWAPLSALTLCGPVATDETIRNKIGKALEALCLLVTQRTATLAETGHSTFQPTEDDPAVIIFIDEVDEIVKHVPGAGRALEFLAGKQRKAAVGLVLATQRAVISALGGGGVRANMTEVLVGATARGSESRHATGAESEIPDIREYSKGAPGYFQRWNPLSKTVTGRGRAFQLGKPPDELAYMKRIVAARHGLRDWGIRDLPPLALDDDGQAEAAPADVTDETAQQITGLRGRLAAITQTATQAVPQPRPAPATTVPLPIPLEIPQADWQTLLRLLAQPDGVSAKEAGEALGKSRSRAGARTEMLEETSELAATVTGILDGASGAGVDPRAIVSLRAAITELDPAGGAPPSYQAGDRTGRHPGSGYGSDAEFLEAVSDAEDQTLDCLREEVAGTGHRRARCGTRRPGPRPAGPAGRPAGPGRRVRHARQEGLRRLPRHQGRRDHRRRDRHRRRGGTGRGRQPAHRHLRGHRRDPGLAHPPPSGRFAGAPPGATRPRRGLRAHLRVHPPRREDAPPWPVDHWGEPRPRLTDPGGRQPAPSSKPSGRHHQMARLQFRLSAIALDEEENVREVTAVVRDDTYGLITSLLGDVNTVGRARGGTEMTIALPARAMWKLFREVGTIPGNDPRYPNGAHDIYDSLTAVVYGLLGE